MHYSQRTLLSPALCIYIAFKHMTIVKQKLKSYSTFLAFLYRIFGMKEPLTWSHGYNFPQAISLPLIFSTILPKSVEQPVSIALGLTLGVGALSAQLTRAKKNPPKNMTVGLVQDESTDLILSESRVMDHKTTSYIYIII